jgi:hypothetical protein
MFYWHLLVDWGPYPTKEQLISPLSLDAKGEMLPLPTMADCNG